MTFATTPDDRDHAIADLDTARAVLEATRRRVAVGQDGHAALATAEYRLNACLRRLDALGWEPPSEPEPDPAA